MEGDFRLGPWVVEPSLNNISRNGSNLRLEPKAMEVLVCLAQHGGSVVPKERLIGKVWPDTFVSDDALIRCISELRRVFEDDPKSPQVIETIPKRGYRLLVKVEPSNPPSPKPPYTLYGIRAAIVIAVWAGAYWIVNRIIHPPSARSVIVLPFKNSSGDTAQDSFTEGLTFLLTNQLAQISALQVISYRSARQYKDTRKSLREIGAEVKADAVVEGEILRSGDKVSVQVQLINVSTDRQLWAHEYQQELGNLTTLAGDCAREIAANLGVKITPQEQARLRKNQPRNPVAYDAYLQARSHLWLENVEDNDAAIDLLEQAIKLDPDFAIARAALARAYRNRNLLFDPHDTDSLERANYEAQKAHDLDPELAEAHLELGYLQWSLQNHYQHEAAITEIRKALELNPSLAEAHHQLGNIYNHIGLLDRAKAEENEAIRLDPANTGARYRRAVNLLYQGNYQEALVKFESSQRFIPCLWATQYAFALFQLGRKEDAALRVDDFLKQCPQDRGGNLTAMEALLLASVGDRAQAERKIKRATLIGEGYQHFHHTAYLIGSAYALMNQPEPAVRFLRQSAAQGFPCYPLFERDPNLSNLRSDPTFVQFMADLKKQWEYFRANLQ
jgi:DNA-binding winged helix-turn-helix (wHTH) protein/TolB-like protein/Tfp pilus assembly protein PilF